MKDTKFIVKVNRDGRRAAEYVKRIDRTPIQVTTNRKLALVMGKIHGQGRCQVHPKFPVQPGSSGVGPRLEIATDVQKLAGVLRSVRNLEEERAPLGRGVPCTRGIGKLRVGYRSG